MPDLCGIKNLDVAILRAMSASRSDMSDSIGREAIEKLARRGLIDAEESPTEEASWLLALPEVAVGYLATTTQTQVSRLLSLAHHRKLNADCIEPRTGAVFVMRGWATKSYRAGIPRLTAGRTTYEITPAGVEIVEAVLGRSLVARAEQL